jgi:acetolactate synthase-1/2/3 large subunit
MHFLKALENPRMRSVLCLFEGVCTGAADGYYRMKGTPGFDPAAPGAGPGERPGQYPQRQARLVGHGQHHRRTFGRAPEIRPAADVRHRRTGASAEPLGAARGVARSVAWDAAAAVAKASEIPGQIATLILPGDASWQEAGAASAAARGRRQPVKAPDAARIDHIAQVLRSGEPALMILAGGATRGRALELAGKIKAATGCRVATQFFSARIERGAGRFTLERIPTRWDRRPTT